MPLLPRLEAERAGETTGLLPIADTVDTAADVVGTPLKAGDRLGPSDELPYTADLDRVNKFPINLVFWRVSPGDKVLHRNPLFSEALGIVPGNLLVDLLHALLLGVIAQVSADLFLVLMLNDVWGSRQDVTQAEWVHSGLIQMRGDFETWFDKLERSRPDWKSTKIQAITLGMVGAPTKRKLALKAVETKFCFTLLGRQARGSRGPSVSVAG